jgi:hypothetical protein
VNIYGMSKSDLLEWLEVTDAQLAALTHAVAEGEISGIQCLFEKVRLDEQRKHIKRILASFGFKKKRSAEPLDALLDSSEFQQPTEIPLRLAAPLLHRGHKVGYRPRNRVIALDWGDST